MMNFFEFNEPYYALIKATNMKQAVVWYIRTVSGEEEDFEYLLAEVNLVESDYAIAKFSRATGEDGLLMEFDEVIDVLRTNETELLLVDGSLI